MSDCEMAQNFLSFFLFLFVTRATKNIFKPVVCGRCAEIHNPIRFIKVHLKDLTDIYLRIQGIYDSLIYAY